MKIFGVLTALLLPFGGFAQDTLTLLFAGDVMQHQTQLNAARTGDTYNYDDYFSIVKKYIEPVDIAVANLEVTLAGKPYSGYPQFCAPDELAVALQEAGFDVLLTANNHSCDKGKRGVERTVKFLDSLDIYHTGTFLTQTERSRTYPLMLEHNNFKVAMLNYTYGTNEIPTPAPTVVNRIDTVQIAADIATAKDLQSDVIVANMHWGEEYKLQPNKEQKMLADFLVRKDVPLIIGSHPHVLQRMERRYDTTRYFEGRSNPTTKNIVVYSLGNFISNMSAKNTDGGVMVYVRLVKQENKVVIDECGYRLVWVYKPVVDGQRRYFLLPVAEFENQQDYFETPAEYTRMMEFTKNMRALFAAENIGFVEYK